MQHTLTTGLARIIPIAFATLALAASPAFAGPLISVGLVGKSFGNGQNLHVVSKGTLDASKVYTITIEGTLKGEGDFSFIDGLTLAELADILAPNGSSKLTKVKSNPSGRRPVRSLYNRGFEGSLGNLSLSFTAFAQITGTGKLVFDINNISITSQSVPLTGKVTFGTGSKIVVTVAPEMHFNSPGQNVLENVGIAKISVVRSKYLKAPATVDYFFTDGTAIDGVDYTKIPGSVSFAAGETKQIIEVPIIDNQVLKDGKRSFKMTLTNPSIGAATGFPVETTVNILNND